MSATDKKDKTISRLKGNNFFLSSLPIIALAAIGFLVYSNTLKSPFLFDDEAHITGNQHIRITKLNLQTLADAAFKSPLPERPVANITFAFNYMIGRYNVAGYHLTNIFIHIISGVFLFLLLKNTLAMPLLRDKFPHPEYLAFAAALLWLIHPVQTQAVTYIVQRMTSLASMFYIISLYFYVKARLAYQSRMRSWPLFLACAIAGLLSFGSKEISATLPFFILLYDWFFFADLKPDWYKKHLPFIFAAFVVILLLSLLYFWAKPVRIMAVEHSRWGFTPVQRVLTEFRVVIFYISLLFYPNPARLSLDHDFSISASLLNPSHTLLAIIIISGLILSAVLSAKKHRLFSFCIFWFFGNLLIESSFLGIELIYEHRLYLPSMLAIFAFACLLWKLLNPNLLKAAAFSIIAMLLLTATYTRNKVWADGITLWQDTAAKSPDKPRPNYNLATAFSERKDYPEAIKYYNKALQLDPNRFDAIEGLGIVYLNLQDYQKAFDYAAKAVALNPQKTHAYYLKGLIFYKQNMLDEAIANLLKAIEIEPTLDKIYNDLAVIYYGRRQTEKAIYYWDTAIRLNPDHAEALNNLAFLLATSPDKKYRNPAKSLELAQRANKVTSNKQPDFLDTLAAAYAANGQFDSAVKTAQKALELAGTQDNNQLIGTIKNRLRLYESSQPFIEQHEKSENTNSELQEKQ